MLFNFVFNLVFVRKCNSVDCPSSDKCTICDESGDGGVNEKCL